MLGKKILSLMLVVLLLSSVLNTGFGTSVFASNYDDDCFGQGDANSIQLIATTTPFIPTVGGGSYDIRSNITPEGLVGYSSFENAHYTIEKIDNYYTLKNNATGKYVQSPTSINVTVTETSTVDDRARWNIISTVNGDYVIESLSLPENYLTLKDNDTKVVLSPYEQTDRQRWNFIFYSEAEIYQNTNYGGNHQSLRIGRYNISDISIGNDKLSSIQVPEGLIVTLYEDSNFKGKSVTYDSSSQSVGNDWHTVGFNDETSSIVVEEKSKVVIAFKDVNYNGYSRTFSIGSHDVQELKDTIGNDCIDSLIVPEGLRVTVYQNGGFSGNSASFTNNVSALRPYGLHDKVSSLIVEYNDLSE